MTRFSRPQPLRIISPQTRILTKEEKRPSTPEQVFIKISGEKAQKKCTKSAFKRTLNAPNTEPKTQSINNLDRKGGGTPPYVANPDPFSGPSQRATWVKHC
jgi:hypothetical protein